MRDEEPESPDPEVGIWGWEETPSPELTLEQRLQKALYEKQQRREEERVREFWRRKKEQERKVSSDFNSHMIQLFNEGRK